MITSLPLVSVIIPTYNRETLVYRAVKSVLSQSYTELECIVIDDCSTDKTLESLTELSKTDQRLRVISHLQNLHASASRNTGLAASQGHLIAFLDSDDTWLPDKLDKQVACLLNSAPEVGLVYCWFDVYRDSEVVDTRRPTLRGYIFDQLLVSQPLGNASTLLVRREVIDKVGGFDESLLRGNDGDFIRRVGQYYEIEVVPEVLVHYFVDHDGYERITGCNNESILKGIRGHEAKLEKFKHELSQRPKIHAELLAVIGFNYMLVNDLASTSSYLASAIKITPFNKKVYKHLLRTLLVFVKKSAFQT